MPSGHQGTLLLCSSQIEIPERPNISFQSFSKILVCHPTFCRGYDSDEDEEDLLDDVIDGGMKDAEGDDLDDRAARFLLYWTTITKVCWQHGVEYHHYDYIIFIQTTSITSYTRSSFLASVTCTPSGFPFSAC